MIIECVHKLFQLIMVEALLGCANIHIKTAFSVVPIREPECIVPICALTRINQFIIVAATWGRYACRSEVGNGWATCVASTIIPNSAIGFAHYAVTKISSITTVFDKMRIIFSLFAWYIAWSNHYSMSARNEL